MKISIARKRAGQRALTRTEVLAAVAVVLLLGALTLTFARRGKTAAGEQACTAKLKRLSDAFEQYGALHPKYPAAARSQKPLTNDWVHWQTDRDLTGSAIAPFLSAPDINALGDALVCPLDTEPGGRRYPFSYTMNAHLERQPAAQLANKSSLILLFEEQKPNDGACAPGEPNDRLAQRHRGLSHAAFGDGRVELVEEIIAVQSDHTRPMVRAIKLPPREVPSS